MRQGSCRAAPAGVPDSALSVGRGCGRWLFTWWFPACAGGAGKTLIADVTGAVVSDGFVHSCLAKAASLVSEVVALIRC